MATRPAWTVKDGVVIRADFSFAWNGGFAITQKQKNISALHQAIKDGTGENALEISSKGTALIGREMSAFSLKRSGIYLENIFQASKKYENGGPYLDLLHVLPKEAKRDDRHKSSGPLAAFVWNQEIWPLMPKTAFYDYLYVSAVIENYGYDLELSDYQWFTDIEFNPKKSINCQARSAAVYQLIKQERLYEVTENMAAWISFHIRYVNG